MMNSNSRRTLYFLLGIYVVLAAGCGPIHLKAGEPLNVEAFQSTLRIGESTREDVLATLGVPDGRGRAMLPIDEEPRTLWFYWYEETQIGGEGGTVDNITILWVYFKDDLYDGSLWASTFAR